MSPSKYRFYVNKCNAISISKIYDTNNDLEQDNKKDIYYDIAFDTTKKDLKIYNSVDKGDKTNETFKMQLFTTYVFDSDKEINDKYDNIINKNDKQRRHIKHGDVCLLKEGNILFRRIGDRWIQIDDTTLKTLDKCYDYNSQFLNMSFGNFMHMYA